MTRGLYLINFALFLPAFFLLVAFAGAQQVDIAVGAGTLLSPTSPNSSVTFQPPAEKDGTYLTVSGDYLRADRNLGLEVETSWRYHQKIYPFNGETYRPFLSALNLLYQPHVTKRIGLDFTGGIGIANTRFYVPYVGACSPTAGCVNFNNTNHFLEDLGVGVRYRVWRHFFVRPEIRYYHIQNNEEFNSNNVFRASVNLGYTFHPN